MNAAYIDTSCLVAVAFAEPSGAPAAQRLSEFDRLFAANLLEAELRSAFAREGLALDPALFGGVSWILPDRPLSRELREVVAQGYVRGADLWHLACALYLVEQRSGDIVFLTLDKRQRELADRLGFRR